MNLERLHRKFKDADSPSVEGQIRWLKKLGFSETQINQAMIEVYSEIERGRLPLKCITPEGVIYILDDDVRSTLWQVSKISCGKELDHSIREIARRYQNKDMEIYAAQLEKFEAAMRLRWERSQKKRGFFSKLLGRSPVNDATS